MDDIKHVDNDLLAALLQQCIADEQLNIVVHVADGVDMLTTPISVRCKHDTIIIDVDMVGYDA